MKKLARIASVLSVLSLLLVTLAGTASAEGGTTVIAEGFNGPQGVLVAPDGSVWVIDSGVGGDTELKIMNPETGKEETAKLGDTAHVVKVVPDGTQTIEASLPSVMTSDGESSGGNRLALLNLCRKSSSRGR